MGGRILATCLLFITNKIGILVNRNQDKEPVQMKRPAVMWQLIISVISVLLTIGVGWVSLTNQVKETATKQRIETDAMKDQIQEIKTSGDKKFDKIDGKMD